MNKLFTTLSIILLYISDARNNYHLDGSSDFDANSATVFVGQGIRFNFSLGFQF